MKEYAWVPHRKDEKKAPFGTGIVWGISTIKPGMDPEQIFKMADLKVEQKKQKTV
ncbi:MAG TPA: hypothetical protein VH280_08100 [Verrucomicrobiae bacterium]|jgi:hypothetical protein|nr:hypothetical protein [Verrucomicrobiae bacterium]